VEARGFILGTAIALNGGVAHAVVLRIAALAGEERLRPLPVIALLSVCPLTVTIS
jgi:hypothetical protein